ncbi:SchA/CurD-like domain-containing protein [Streptomyces sp. NPDC059590]|uniref:SchA/CurD-like domain-containing protein n=1 Tax=Streptomyces sp. NPDC059590 TaxID=3346877 RepID=UPI0036BA49D9
MSTLPKTSRPAKSTTTTEPPPRQSMLTDARLRVVLLVSVHAGAEERFLHAYEQLSQQVAAVPGHISDQLCQSIENPSQWLITSEWESAPPFLSWVESPAHREMVKPLHGCVEDTRSLRFSVLRETFSGKGASGRRAAPPVQLAPRIGDGLVRHALTFTVKPGSEGSVAKILADYAAPEARVDEHTRLCRTSLFMSGNRVVRAVEVKGDLVAALRHVARQPEVRAVEEAINPHLEEDRDLDDPEAARAFFMRAALPVVHHLTADPSRPPNLHRHMLLYPVKTGCGPAVASLLSRQDDLAVSKAKSAMASGKGRHTIVSSTVFQRDDIVVRMVDMGVPLDSEPAVAAGVSGPRAAAVLTRLLDAGGAGKKKIDLVGEAGLRRFLDDCDMAQVTDRRAADY